MIIAALMIGLREGLEAALIVGILLAYLKQGQLHHLKKYIWGGVTTAIVLSLALGALFTFGRYSLSFKAQEIIGGSLSLLAVAMITSMVLWISNLTAALKTSMDKALKTSTWALFTLAFITVGREGIETTLMLWGWATNPLALLAALAGILIATALGWAIHTGAMRFNLRTFFTASGYFLILVAAGVLAYGIHDLQEAAILPGPFSGAPIAPTHPRTGEVLTGFTTYPFWLASFPFGWAFNVSHIIPPDGLPAALLKGIFGFVPQMTWLEVTAWATYLTIVLPRFISRTRKAKKQ